MVGVKLPLAILTLCATSAMAQPKYEVYAIRYATIKDFAVSGLIAGADKSQASIETDHYFTTPGARSEQADTIARWISKRWR